MGSRFLLDLADVCRSTGYPVLEVDGWQTRARGSGGYVSPKPDHVAAHHTASGPSSDGWPDVNYLCFGDEDAPLANLYLSRSGEIFVCAAGATNTNGSGTDPCGLIANDTLNSSAVGIEAGNNGTGEPWALVQQDAYVALCAALCSSYGIGFEQVHAHWEWTTRKIDPAGPSRWASSGSWDMDGFRDDISNGPGPAPAPPEPPRPVERRKSMADFVVSYGEPLPDGTVYEIVNGTKRPVDQGEFFEVLKGVVMDRHGGVVEHAPWQPVAFVANAWVLNGLPNWEQS